MPTILTAALPRIIRHPPRIRPGSRADRRPAADLTPREREVLGFLARGKANKQIARELGISEKTVKAHLTRVFEAIGVSDRTAAALWAQRHGLD